MENEQKTTEHMRDGHGNVIIMPNKKPMTFEARLRHFSIVSCMVALLLLITTCVLGVSLTSARAAINKQSNEQDPPTNNFVVEPLSVQEEEQEQNEPVVKVWGYYFEYEF